MTYLYIGQVGRLRGNLCPRRQQRPRSDVEVEIQPPPPPPPPVGTAAAAEVIVATEVMIQSDLVTRAVDCDNMKPIGISGDAAQGTQRDNEPLQSQYHSSVRSQEAINRKTDKKNKEEEDVEEKERN